MSLGASQQVMNANQLLYGPNSFYCERFSCRMLKQRCVERQKRSSSGSIRIGTMNLSSKAYGLCENCIQGKQIKKECGEQTNLFQIEEWPRMHSENEIDQLAELEQKIEYLIDGAKKFKQEKEDLSQELQMQEEKLASTSAELENLKSVRDNCRLRILSILEKIERAGFG